MEPAATPIDNLVAHALNAAIPPEIGTMADSLRDKLGESVVAILAYGSCLRGVSASESLIDFYVLVRSASDVSTSRLAQWACRVIPPNVYYGETHAGSVSLRCKYAVLPLDQFAQWMRPQTANPYFWARFAQPTAIVYAVDHETNLRLRSALAMALRTAYAHAKGIPGAGKDPQLTWQLLFENTYATELRSERPERARDVVNANRDYFQTAGLLLADEPAIQSAWWQRRMTGRLWSVSRLVKAAFTFTGGADYLAWKVERHSGHKITLTEWQRRHPVLTSLMLLPRLLLKGAVR
jgi:hypothetical protein